MPRFLLSEALRGEGAWLRNDRGERFMERYHPLLELAPRDVVARAITREGINARAPQAGRPVYLDMRHLAQDHPSLDLAARFPGISAFLAKHNLLLSRDLIPVRPAAHYLMGGVETDMHGRTSLAGLYAAGEVACTGVHGANRLASNSLLEGLVFGARAAEAMLAEPSPAATGSVPPQQRLFATTTVTETRRTLQAEMWRDAGLLRSGEGLARALACLRDLRARAAGAQAPTTREAVELGNLLDLSELIVRSAIAREESRGAHYRNDFPQRDDAHYARHSIVTGDAPVTFAPRLL